MSVTCKLSGIVFFIIIFKANVYFLSVYFSLFLTRQIFRDFHLKRLQDDGALCWAFDRDTNRIKLL